MKTIRSLIGSALARNTARNAPQVIHLPDANAPAANARWSQALRGDSNQPATKRTIRKRIAVLLAAIAVPAMAAPGDFGALAGSAPTQAELVNAQLARQLAENPAMPFERPGMSFPGSAFYFLADPPSEALIALPTTDATDPGAEAGRELGELIDAGPSARPFFGGEGRNHTRALDCLAQAVWYEAASESEAGQRAVAQVVLNRVSHSAWPGSVCGVVYQGSQRTTGCQFSFTCDGSLARRASGSTWARAQRIAGEALAGMVYQPIGHATHYHTLWVNPYWASSLEHVGTIGAHRFYRKRGAAGESGAFTRSYSGVEPGVSGRMTAPPAFESTSDMAMPALPDTSSRATTSGQRSPSRSNFVSSGAAPAPILADPAYSGVGQVREDYARAGQWRSDAAREAMEAEQRSLAEERAQNASSASPQISPPLPPTSPAQTP